MSQYFINSNDDLQRNSNIIALLLVSGINLCCITVSFVIASDAYLPADYHLLFLLPIAFGIISCLFFQIYKFIFKLYTVGIVVALYFLRMTAIPLFMYLGRYSKISRNSQVESYIGKAVLLMIYEFFFVMVVIFFAVRQISDFSGAKIKKLQYKNEADMSLIKFVISIMAIAALFLFIKYPLLRSYLAPISTLSPENQAMYYNDSVQRRILIPGIILWPYYLLVDILRQVIPLYIIHSLYQHSVHSGKNGMAIFLSLCMIVLSCCMVTDEKALSFLIAITEFIIIYYFYSKQIKKLAPFSILVFIFGMGAGLYLKTKLSLSQNFYSDLSNVLQNYFSGPEGVAVALTIHKIASPVVWISDLGNSIPLFGHFFSNLPTSRDLFNQTFYQNSNLRTNYLIIPMVGQGAYYVTAVFAPLLSGLAVYLSIKLNLEIEKQKDMFCQYASIFLSLAFAISPIMYNLSIAWDYFFLMVFSMYGFSLMPKFIKVYRTKECKNNTRNRMGKSAGSIKAGL
jgi:hypothetical protein